MMSKRPNSTAMRRKCFDAHRRIHPVTDRVILVCHVCGLAFDPVKEPWEAEHVLPLNCGGTNDPDNLLPAHASCHAGKTSGEATVRAQVKRGADHHYGIKRSARPMVCGRRSPFKKRMDGSVVRRDQE